VAWTKLCCLRSSSQYRQGLPFSSLHAFPSRILLTWHRVMLLGWYLVANNIARTLLTSILRDVTGRGYRN
jgi:hypothetical protein